MIVFAKGSELYSGHVEFVGGPRSLNIMESISISPLAWNNGSLRSSSAKIQPTDHMSTAVEYVVAPRRISGALYRSRISKTARDSRIKMKIPTDTTA